MRVPEQHLLLNRRTFLALSALAPFGLERTAAHAAGDSAASTERQVFVQTKKPKQIIEHFGASDCWMIDPVGKAWDAANKELLADLLFSRDKGIGLSLWRFNLGAGDTRGDGYWNPWRRVECLQSAPSAPIDGTKQSGQQWFLKAAKRRGVEKTLAFVNSPPVWLTKNGRAFGDKKEPNTNLKPGSEVAFGKYLADILRYFEEQRLAFDYVSPANEPNWRWTEGQEGCSYHPEELRTMALAVAKELASAKVKARVRLGELGDYPSLLDDADYRTYRGIAKPDVVNGGDRQYFKTVLGDASTRKAVDDCFLAHSYWTDASPHDLEALRTQVRTNFARYVPGGRFWQSEYCIMEHKRDLGMDTALRVASVIHHDLTFTGATSWSWWTALSQGDYKDGLIYTDYNGESNTTPNILPSKTLWALGNWSRFVRPGAQRVQVLTDALPAELLASAFVSADKRDLIVVVVNPSADTVPMRFGADRMVRAFTPYVTDATRDLAAGKPLPTDVPLPVPPRSVITLIGRMGASAASTPASLRTPAQRELPLGKYLYVVQCGASAMDKATDARRNSRYDMPYGRDPGTGFFWGYVGYGDTNGHAVEKQEHVHSVRVEEGDTAGQGITYCFAVLPGQALILEIDWFDPWNNPDRRMDIRVQGQTVEKGLVSGQALVTRSYPVAGSAEGMVEVQIVRSADNPIPSADPVVAGIRLRETDTVVRVRG